MRYKISYLSYLILAKYKLAGQIILLAVVLYITVLGKTESNSTFDYLFYTLFILASTLLLELEPYLTHRAIYRFIQSEEMHQLITIQEMHTLFGKWSYKIVIQTTINELEMYINISTTFGKSGKKHFVNIQTTTAEGIIKKDYQLNKIKELQGIIVKLKNQYK